MLTRGLVRRDALKHTPTTALLEVQAEERENGEVRYRQYLERGAWGRRFVNLSPLIQRAKCGKFHKLR